MDEMHDDIVSILRKHKRPLASTDIRKYSRFKYTSNAIAHVCNNSHLIEKVGVIKEYGIPKWNLYALKGTG